MRARLPIALLVASVTLLGCASAPRPTPAPPGSPGAPFLVTTDADRSSVTTWGLVDGALAPLATITLSEPAWGWAWRGQAELVLLGSDDPVRILDLARGAERVLPEPPESAWGLPPGYTPENPDGLAPDEYEGDVVTEVRGSEIWKGRCVDAVINEGALCTAYNWVRLDPPGAATHVGMPAPPPPRPAGARAPAGFALTSVMQVRATTDFPDAGPVPHVRCVGPQAEMLFPAARADAGYDEPDARYDTVVYEAGSPRWLGHLAPLWTAVGTTVGMDTRPADFVFEGCVEAPLFRAEARLVEGPTTPARWVAVRSAFDEEEWIVYRDGLRVGTLPAGDLTFVPTPDGAAAVSR